MLLLWLLLLLRRRNQHEKKTMYASSRVFLEISLLIMLCYVIRSIVKNLLMWKKAPHKVNNIVKKFNNSLLLTSRSQTYRM